MRQFELRVSVAASSLVRVQRATSSQRGDQLRHVTQLQSVVVSLRARNDITAVCADIPAGPITASPHRLPVRRRGPFCRRLTRFALSRRRLCDVVASRRLGSMTSCFRLFRSHYVWQANKENASFNLKRSSKSSTPLPPLLVHCSAGVGRTGTFCIVHSMLERFRRAEKAERDALAALKKRAKAARDDAPSAATPAPSDVSSDATKLSVLQALYALRAQVGARSCVFDRAENRCARRQRPGSIQTKEQYRFCYLSLREQARRRRMSFCRLLGFDAAVGADYGASRADGGGGALVVVVVVQEERSSRLEKRRRALVFRCALDGCIESPLDFCQPLSAQAKKARKAVDRADTRQSPTNASPTPL